ncbi:unnamed protein product [Spirodela intermedia]|uniref:Uncharacterized protein n=1 Tax=Spirodela intermedia TaxID=51605 RepID=A0A7I8L5K5_SPIIN|nr:unnamed protein product [Spirodela intermedia]
MVAPAISSLIVAVVFSVDSEWKTRAGNICVASFDWSCCGVCKAVDHMKEVHRTCGEGEAAVWNVSV